MSRTKKAMSPREARERGQTGDYRPTGKQSRGKKRRKANQETREEIMLRQGGWRPIIISPEAHPPLVLFVDPWGLDMVTVDVALERERSRPEPTGEMLEVVGKGSSIPHDPDNGIPWIWGQPPWPKQPSNRELRQKKDPPEAEMMVNVNTGERTPKNRKYRRKHLQHKAG